jgi:GT2 family glycosyltransferase
MTPDRNVLMSVVVLNYKRRDELARTLESIRTQNYEPREVILVDNGSGDGTLEFVRDAFPEVAVLDLGVNAGCAGRNRGVESARGEYVVSLDNDVRFDSPGELRKVAELFQKQPDSSVLVFKILDNDGARLHMRDWCHPREARVYADREFDTYYIAEGACAFRRADFLRLGGYYEPFHIGGEGWDLSLRMIDAGMRIRYCPAIRVRHAMAHETRGARRPYYFYTRNSIWTAYKNYRGWGRTKFLAYTFAKMLYFSIRPSRFIDLVRGLRDGYAGLSTLPRTAVSNAGWRRLRELGAERPGWYTRLKTHWAQQDI